MTHPDPNAQSGDGQGQQSGQAGGDPSGANDAGTGAQGGASGTGDSGTQSGTPETVSKADFDALRARLQAADQRAGKAEGDLRQLRDKDLPEMEKIKRDLSDLTTTNEKLGQANRQLRIENAFLTDNTHKWRNPGTAMKLLDQSKLDIDSEGNVTGMKDALKALANSDPYLLEPTGDGTTGSEGDKGSSPAGTPPANTGGTGSANATSQQLRSRFAPLRGRLGTSR